MKRQNELRDSILREMVMRIMNEYYERQTDYNRVLVALQIFQEVTGTAYQGDIITEDYKFTKCVNYNWMSK